jgi:NADH-quinone oxidoreductase subunit N
MIFFGALGSIIIGCFGALIQRRIKRFLAYTSINQVGFLLLGLGMCDVYGLASTFLFLIIYLTMNIIFFCLILNVKHFIESTQITYLTDLYSLSLYNIYFSNL